MRTGLIYNYRLLTVQYQTGKRLRPIALVGMSAYFTFVMIRVQPVDENDDPVLAHVLDTLHTELSKRLETRGTRGLAAWIDGQCFDQTRSLRAALEPEERSFTLTPHRNNVLAEAQRVYCDIVLGRAQDKLLAPQAIWARELPFFMLYPARVTARAASSR